MKSGMYLDGRFARLFGLKPHYHFMRGQWWVCPWGRAEFRLGAKSVWAPFPFEDGS